VSLAQRLEIPPDTDRSLRFAAYFYLAHILCQGWIGSSEIFLGLGVIALGFAVYRGVAEIRFHPIYFPLIVFVAGSELSALAARNRGHSVLEVSEAFTFLTFPLGLTLYRTIPNLIRKGLLAFLILGFYEAGYGIFQYLILAPHDVEHRITGTAAHVMTYSGIVLPLSLLFLIIGLDERDYRYLSAAAATSLALLLTLTRGAWIGWLTGVTVYLVRRRARALFLLLPLLILGITFSPMNLFSRFVSVFDAKQSSNLDRIRMVQAGVEMIRDNPMLGVGPGNVKETYPLYREPDAPRFRIPHLHNNLVQLWAERGIVAFLGYVLLIGFFVRECLRRKVRSGAARTWSDAGLAVATSLTCAGLFEFNFGDSEILLHLLDLFAISAAALELLDRSARDVVPGASTSPEPLAGAGRVFPEPAPVTFQ